MKREFTHFDMSVLPTHQMFLLNQNIFWSPLILCSFGSLIDTHLIFSLPVLIYFVSIVADLKYLLQSQF